MPQDRWYKDGLFYELSVRTFGDSNGDGVGDLQGVIERLDHLSGLGVTCVWLMPFYPSPWRDDGYDVTDFYGVHPDLGTLRDFVSLVHQAEARGIRVMVDLVINHTSTEHPWFKAAREGHPKYRDYYIWSDEKPEDADQGMVFPGVQETTWTYETTAGRYYFHRFYRFQPDLNIANPEVREEMKRIISFWLELGAAGFRVDAVPFLIEPAGAEGEHPGPRFEYLHVLREQASWRRGDAVLLGEANIDRDKIQDYYVVGGMHMLFNFQANQAMWLSFAREDTRPLLAALRETAGIPETDQWANFLRNHDEVDLGRLTEQEREDVFARFAPEPRMQLYHRGIRRRLAPMLGHDRRRVELAISLMLSLPGTPVLYYGDEVGMDDDLSRPERMAVRTPMAWEEVERQRRDPDSLLNAVTRAVGARRGVPEFGGGSWQPLDTSDPSVLAIRYRREAGTVVAVHNLADRPQHVDVPDLGEAFDVFADRRYGDPKDGDIDLDPYGYRWLRVTVSG